MITDSSLYQWIPAAQNRHAAKLNALHAVLIRTLKADGVSSYVLAERFGVSQSQIIQICNGIQHHNTPLHPDVFDREWKPQTLKPIEERLRESAWKAHKIVRRTIKEKYGL